MNAQKSTLYSKLTSSVKPQKWKPLTTIPVNHELLFFVHSMKNICSSVLIVLQNILFIIALFKFQNMLTLFLKIYFNYFCIFLYMRFYFFRRKFSSFQINFLSISLIVSLLHYINSIILSI